MRGARALPVPGVPPMVEDGAGPPRWWWQPFEPPAPWGGLGEDLGQTAEILRERTMTTVSEEVRQLQLALKAAGYDPGPIDGLWGPRTQAALQAYQAGGGRAISVPPTSTRPAPVPTTAAAGLPGPTWWIIGGVGVLAVVLLLAAPGLTPPPSRTARGPRRRARRRRR